MKPSRRFDEMMDIGNVLVKLGFTTDGQVEAAALRQLDDRRRIGDILVDMGAVTREQLEDALALQRRLRNPARRLDAAAELVRRSGEHVLEVAKTVSGR